MGAKERFTLCFSVAAAMAAISSATGRDSGAPPRDDELLCDEQQGAFWVRSAAIAAAPGAIDKPVWDIILVITPDILSKF